MTKDKELIDLEHKLRMEHQKEMQKFAEDLDVRFWCAKRIGLMEFFNLKEKDLKEKEE